MARTMTIDRRHLLVSASLAPFVASCASGLQSYRHLSTAEVAAKQGICSAAYATLSGGKVQKTAAVSGCAGQSPAVNAVYQAASLTKPVVAYAALKLALAGGLDLRSPVSRFLPHGYTHFHRVLAQGAQDPSDLVPAATLSRIPLFTLLNHSSGFPNWSRGPLSLGFEPGARWQYSGAGYVLLQRVLEAVSGQSFLSFMDAQVFTPLGMHQSSLVWKEEYAVYTQPGAAAAWSPRSARFTSPVAAASLHTTAADYARFLAAVLADPRLLAETLSAPVSVAPGLGIDWGYGWGIERQARGANLWHWGNNPGFRAFTMVSPESGDGFVVFTGSDQGMALAVPIAHEVLPMEHNAFRFSMVG
jgi:CubicO group peptidase (beta-lactamase class C family)